jgi:hypothetical protein
MDIRAFVLAAGVGLALQVAMVVGGHHVAALKPYFGPGGMMISLVAGALFAWIAGGGSWPTAIVGGALAGAVCALVGIALSHFMGDVPASLIALGSLASAVAGALGGALVKFFS